MAIKSEDVELGGITTDIIFQMSQAACERAGMNIRDIMNSDP